MQAETQRMICNRGYKVIKMEQQIVRIFVEKSILSMDDQYTV